MMEPESKRRYAWTLLLVALCSVGARAQGPSPDVARLLEYDRAAPLDVKEVSAETRGGVTLHDLSYASPKGGRVTAYLVVPPGKGPFPAILFQHWGQGNRSSFVAEALLYARAGAVALLIDAPFSRPHPSYRPSNFDPESDSDRDALVQGIVDLRRGLDLLTSRPDVDPKRLAYVGLSYGANTGAALAAFDRRAKTYVLMGGPPSVTQMYREIDHPGLVRLRGRMPTQDFERYLARLAPFDPVNFIGRAAPASLLLQFARHDWYVSEAAARRYEQAASSPKEVRWYDGGHEFNDPESLADRAAWLRKEIGIAAVRFAGRLPD
jgi:dienelactone hydrolase